MSHLTHLFIGYKTYNMNSLSLPKFLSCPQFIIECHPQTYLLVDILAHQLGFLMTPIVLNDTLSLVYLSGLIIYV